MHQLPQRFDEDRDNLRKLYKGSWYNKNVFFSEPVAVKNLYTTAEDFERRGLCRKEGPQRQYNPCNFEIPSAKSWPFHTEEHKRAYGKALSNARQLLHEDCLDMRDKSFKEPTGPPMTYIRRAPSAIPDQYITEEEKCLLHRPVLIKATGVVPPPPPIDDKMYVTDFARGHCGRLYAYSRVVVPPKCRAQVEKKLCDNWHYEQEKTRMLRGCCRPQQAAGLTEADVAAHFSPSGRPLDDKCPVKPYVRAVKRDYVNFVLSRFERGIV